MKIDRVDFRIEPEMKKKYQRHARERGVSLGQWFLNAAAEQYERETNPRPSYSEYPRKGDK